MTDISREDGRERPDIVDRLQQVQGDNEDAREAAAVIEHLRESCIQIALDKDVIIERLRAALAELVDAVTAEVNEKGGGGYILARLSDARRDLEPKP